MAFIQALFSLLSRSLGKILNAIFGWAVVALFGQTTPTQKTLLSGLVGLAAAWPVLILGVAFPKIAAAIVAFVPPSAQGPSWVMRVIWLVLVLAVPITVGVVVASKAPPGSPKEPFLKKVLRGFPITLALAVAFLLTFVSVPFIRISAMMRRYKDEHVPLVTAADGYDEVALRIDRLVERQDIDADRAPAPWWLSGPSTVLLKLGGRAFRSFIPQQLAYWHGPRLEVALYPSDLLLRGAPKLTAFAHGVITEDLVASAALQTFDPAAQDLERQIRRVWNVYRENPAAHVHAGALLGRLRDITNQLGVIDVPYEEWTILYRQCAQLGRALDGKPQLLAKGNDMTDEKTAEKPASAAAGHSNLGRVDTRASVAAMSSPKLALEVTGEALNLIKAELELAKTELKADLKTEVAAAKGLSVAAVCGLLFLCMALVAGALALGTVMPAWGAALAVAGFVLVIGGIAGAIGWKHVKAPLARTRKSVEQDVRWVKERTA
jgi:MFS family permease